MTDSTIDPWTRQQVADDAGAPPSSGPVDQSYSHSDRWPSLDRLPFEPPVRWDTGLSDKAWPDRPVRRGDVPPAARRPPEDRTKWLVALAVLSALLLLAVVVLAGYLVGQSSNETAAPSTTTPTTAPATPTTPVPSTPPTSSADPTTQPTAPPTTVDPNQVKAEVAQLEQFVQKARGLNYQQPPTVTVLDEQSFKDRLGAEIDRQKDALQAEGTYLKTLGLIPPDADYFTEYRKAYTDYVAGYYTLDTKELLVKGTTVDDHVRSVLVHELTHALDDQWFKLDRSDQYKDAKDEIAFGFKVLFEGDAVHVANQYVRTLPAVEQAGELQGQPGGGVPGLDPNGGSNPITQSLAAPYPFGEALVTDIMAHGGLDELNKDFNDPPVTSEQAMHPEKYRAREPAADVPLPPTDGNGEGTDLGMIGEFTTGQMLIPVVGGDAATQAAAGWGGDHAVGYADKQKNLACIRADYVMDTPADFTELQTAFTNWAKAGSNRTVETPSPTTLRVTTCIPPPPPPGGGSKV